MPDRAYFVLFQDRIATDADAQEVLKEGRLINGLDESFLSSPDEDALVHYSNLGVSYGFLSDDRAEELKVTPFVQKVVEADYYFAIPDTPTTVERYIDEQPQAFPWNLRQIGIPDAWNESRGKGVKVALLDTGVDFTHTSLNHLPTKGISIVPMADPFADSNGHGTHCAGIIAGEDRFGVAPECSLHSVKVLDNSGTGHPRTIIAGISWCIQEKIDVISLSWGNDPDCRSDPDRYTEQYFLLQQILSRTVAAGCVVIAAAGRRSHMSIPAACTDCIAVGSVDETERLSNDSPAAHSSVKTENRVELVAPGVWVRTTRPGGGDTWVSGTSVACPHAAGAAALLKSKGYTPAQIRDRLRRGAKDIMDPGDDRFSGYGIIDVHKSFQL